MSIDSNDGVLVGGRGRPTREVTARRLRMIAEHLDKYGDDQWSECPLYHAMTEGSFFKLVKKVANMGPRGLVRDLLEQSARAALQAASGQDAGLNRRTGIDLLDMDTPPSQGVIEADERTAYRAVDVLLQANKIMADADLVISASTGKRKNGSRMVRDAKMVIAANTLKLRTMETVANVQERVWGINRMREAHEAVMRSIRQASPEVAAQILEELAETDQRYGVTFRS